MVFNQWQMTQKKRNRNNETKNCLKTLIMWIAQTTRRILNKEKKKKNREHKSKFILGFIKKSISRFKLKN